MSPEAPSTRRDRISRAIAIMIEQLSRSLASQSFSAGLNPAQWAALRHFASANESARHIGAFARLHQTTHASAAQTITALVGKGLLRKTPGDEDGRQRILSLTAKGAAMLQNDPLNDLATTISSLSDERLYSAAEILEILVRSALAKTSGE